jgi:Ca2+-transporting ATPase
MLKDNNLVRILASGEKMSNATTICCDKTGTLTLNEMTVMSGAIGTTLGFYYTKDDVTRDSLTANKTAAAPNIVSTAKFFDSISSEVRDILIQSIVINSTAFETYSDGKTTFVGSKTESALLALAKERMGVGPIDHVRASTQEVQVIPFDSSRKYMATIVQLSRNKFRAYVKGAPEIILERSSLVVRTATEAIKTVPLSKDLSEIFTNILDEYASHALRAIGFAFRDFDHWPPRGAKMLNGDMKSVIFDHIFHDMVFIGITGIQDPLRPGVTEAVAKCQHAGVNVKMVTGDNIGTAKAIATECGILTSEGIALEGTDFRRLSTEELDAILPRLQVLARSTPGDKKTIVQRLKALGEVVAVTGDGTNDGPALRSADVGFSMGITGTEVAKKSASIILLDDNFSSIVKAIEWGRTVNDAIRKFLQVSRELLH